VIIKMEKTKIAISARMLKKIPDDGISRFTFEVVTRLIADHPEHSFALISDRKMESDSFPENTEIHFLPPRARHPFQWYLWHEWQLPQLLKKTGAGLFISPDGIVPLRSPIPSISVIHDISFYHRPGDVPFLTSHYYRYFFRKFALKAAGIVTVSHFCRDDISSFFNISPGKIEVAWNGVSEYFSPAGREESFAFRQNLTGGVPYFLFVGNFSPRKNIPGLIKAYNLFRKSTGLNHKLVLTGGRLFLNSETDRLIRNSEWKDDIILTGPKRHEELRMLYSSASALVFTPWFEGFGIPAAEAMRCGTPAILSDTTSLPEIGGNAALFANPGKPEDIAIAMTRIANDKELCSSLSSAGLEQSMKFTWDNTARCVWRSVEKAIL
jgi:glycosyltransferase involved in cell wall biosynthesis